jgi:large repetitive protein
MNPSARIVHVFAATVVAAASGACVGAPTLPSSTITTLTIVGSPPVVGATSQYSANAIVANSADVENVTSLATWQIANTAVATVSRTGLVTGVTVGNTTLTATYSSTTVTQQLSIP